MRGLKDRKTYDPSSNHQHHRPISFELHRHRTESPLTQPLPPNPGGRGVRQCPPITDDTYNR